MTANKWGLVATILTLAGLGFAAMSTNPLFAVPSWVPIVFFILAGLTLLWLIILLIKDRVKKGGKMETEEKYKSIVKDSEFHAKVGNADKASAMEVNNPAIITSVKAHLEANNVKDAAAFRSGQGITAILTPCQNCGKPIPLALTGKPSGKVKIECPHCHCMNVKDIS